MFERMTSKEDFFAAFNEVTRSHETVQKLFRLKLVRITHIKGKGVNIENVEIKRAKVTLDKDKEGITFVFERNLMSYYFTASHPKVLGDSIHLKTTNGLEVVFSVE